MEDNDIMTREDRIRHPIAKGIFYPSDPGKLDETLQNHLSESEETIRGIENQEGETISALIVPHASYQLAGTVLASAFNMLMLKDRPDRFKRVILLSTVHRDEEKKVFLPDFHAFRIPTADIPVDIEGIQKLIGYHPLFELNDDPHREEHAQEIVLPFLHRCLPDARILPLLLGSNSPGLINPVSRSLRLFIEAEADSTLIIVSTNLSRFTKIHIARDQAEKISAALISGPPRISSALQSAGTSAICGSGGILSTVACFQHRIRFIELMTSSSGPIRPENREVWYGSFCGLHIEE